GGLLRRGTGVRIARRERLALVQRLRANLADMVDAHQADHMVALALIERRLRLRVARRGTRGVRHAGNRAQGAVELANEAIDVHGLGGSGTKLNQPVMMYLCSVGETT